MRVELLRRLNAVVCSVVMRTVWSLVSVSWVLFHVAVMGPRIKVRSGVVFHLTELPWRVAESGSLSKRKE